MGEQRRARGPRPGTERGGIAALAGGGPSIVGTVGAMRARDVSRPRPADEAAAERDLVVKRRPPERTERT
jgi:hypothetical protein